MVYREGELSKARMDREWPHQLARPAAHCHGRNYITIRLFWEPQSLCPRRTHSAGTIKTRSFPALPSATTRRNSAPGSAAISSKRPAEVAGLNEITTYCSRLQILYPALQRAVVVLAHDHVHVPAVAINERTTQRREIRNRRRVSLALPYGQQHHRPPRLERPAFPLQPHPRGLTSGAPRSNPFGIISSRPSR